MAAQSTRDRILTVAKDLFYREGIRNVGIDAIVKRAGVTKPTLYYYFPSKDELVVAYLELREAAILASLKKTMDTAEGDVADKIGAVFAAVARETPNPRWKGCPLVRSAAEFAGDPQHMVRKLASTHKKRVEQWFEAAVREAGLADAPLKARQLAVLLDGAITHAFVHGDPDYAMAARAAVRALLKA